ncbi:hypothetical protein SELMODRAFT_438843 [Selaginella moellendorffii]|uniref:Uncharacterized protein n=1 Tax=Selaginella moellendorffii TaxID=88036 RepID=D8QZV3_SELML|nr:hypothetical protein SELMODRAFT_438843 [Selaginella moellendorffii]
MDPAERPREDDPSYALPRFQGPSCVDQKRGRAGGGFGLAVLEGGEIVFDGKVLQSVVLSAGVANGGLCKLKWCLGVYLYRRMMRTCHYILQSSPHPWAEETIMFSSAAMPPEDESSPGERCASANHRVPVVVPLRHRLAKLPRCCSMICAADGGACEMMEPRNGPSKAINLLSLLCLFLYAARVTRQGCDFMRRSLGESMPLPFKMVSTSLAQREKVQAELIPQIHLLLWACLF